MKDSPAVVPGKLAEGGNLSGQPQVTTEASIYSYSFLYI